MSLNPHSQALADTRLYEQETSLALLALTYGIDQASMVDFSLNVNPFGCSQSAIDAATRSLGLANQYPDVNLSALRSALSKKHNQPNERFFFGGGLDDVIKLILQAWTSEGDNILVHLPTFPRYALEARLRGCNVIESQGDIAIRFDAQAYERALGDHAIALAFICTPNNPTGEIIEQHVIEHLVGRFSETIFVIDEALINPLKEGASGLANRFSNVVILRTFSKFFGLAGLRVGYAIASEVLVKVAEIGRPPFNVSLSGAAAAESAITDVEFLQECGRRFANEADYFREQLHSHTSINVVGAHGNMILLELSVGSSAEMASALLKKGLVVADATSFQGLEKTATLRVSLKDRELNERLIAALIDIDQKRCASFSA